MEPISKKSEVIDNYYDDKAKLLANSLTGGIYDLGQLLWEGNPLSYMTGEDFPGIGEWATGMTPFEDGGGTFFDYDEGFEPFGFEPESAEEVGRLLSSFAVPFGGIFAAPNKAGKAIDMMSKVFPSMKYFQDLGNLNKINRAYKYMKNKIPGQPSGLTKVWDSFVKPITQTFHRPIWAPLKRTTSKSDIKNKIPKFHHTRRPEINYAKTAARNWALATGARAGIEGLQYAAKKDAAPSFISTAGAAEPPSYSNYQDPIMKMVEPNRPRIGIQFSDGPTYWG